MSNHLHLSEVTLAGIRFKNRIGLAAGFDKDGIALIGLANLGFGFLEVGTVTRSPQKGNSKPRMMRIQEKHAIINRMGFNNCGVENVCKRIGKNKRRIGVPIGVNIGRSASTSNTNAVGDYEFCLNHAKDVADYITVNISSPNTPGLRELSKLNQVRDFLITLIRFREQLSGTAKSIPIFVKISPDEDRDAVARLSQQIKDVGCDGIIATNTTVRRDNVDHAYSKIDGGLSGKPLYELACRTVEIVRNSIAEDFPIIGVGGIDSPATAMSMLSAGADLLQIYTGLIYQGPALARRLSRSCAGENEH